MKICEDDVENMDGAWLATYTGTRGTSNGSPCIMRSYIYYSVALPCCHWKLNHDHRHFYGAKIKQKSISIFYRTFVRMFHTLPCSHVAMYHRCRATLMNSRMDCNAFTIRTTQTSKLEQTNYFKLFIFSVSIRIDSPFHVLYVRRSAIIVPTPYRTLYFAWSPSSGICKAFALAIETKMNNDCALLRSHAKDPTSLRS